MSTENFNDFSEISTGDIEDNPKWIQSLGVHEANFESPIDINISKTIEIQLPKIMWHHLDLPPKKMKMTNTGYTMILSAKWHQERPYLSRGPFLGNYVFSQLHFHWGRNDGEGSEHTVDGAHYPLEMHVVTFRSSYLTQESALKEKDGVSVLVYMFKTQDNPSFQVLVDSILSIQKPHTSIKIEPIPLSHFVKQFEEDYFLYWGSVATSVCTHFILWLICRIPLGVSIEQVEALRALLDVNEDPLIGNFRNVQPLKGRRLFHVCPSGQKHSTLLPFP